MTCKLGAPLTVDEASPLEIVGATLEGRVNTSNDGLLDNIRFAIRQGHPQAKPEMVKPERVALVGSGVSLGHTEQELRDLVFEGARIVTLNGAYHWCRERNIRPWMQIVMDARPGNARFLMPETPNCSYWLASQCHPEAWKAVADYEKVRIFHAANPDGVERPVLDEYYGGHWTGVCGGTTVGTRAIGLLRMLGFLRFDLFGIDSCWMPSHWQLERDGQPMRGPDGSILEYASKAEAQRAAEAPGCGGTPSGVLGHHAFEQPENTRDKAIRIIVKSADGEDDGRGFVCSPWHIKQFEDFLQFVRSAGHMFLLNVHGDGLLAYTISRNGNIAYRTE